MQMSRLHVIMPFHSPTMHRLTAGAENGGYLQAMRPPSNVDTEGGACQDF